MYIVHIAFKQRSIISGEESANSSLNGSPVNKNVVENENWEKGTLSYVKTFYQTKCK